MKFIEGLRRKEKQEVQQLLEKKPIVIMDSFFDDGDKLFFEETFGEACGCSSILLEPGNLTKPIFSKLKKSIWKVCKETLMREWKKPLVPELRENLIVRKPKEESDVLELIKEQDREEGIKNRLIIVYIFGFIEKGENEKLLDYFKKHEDHFKFIFYDYPEWYKSYKWFDKNKEYSTYTLKPYSEEDINKIKKQLGINSYLETIIGISGGLPFFFIRKKPLEFTGLLHVFIEDISGYEKLGYKFDEKQLCALFTIRNGLGTNKYYKEYESELNFLEKYGIIDLSKIEKPILSSFLKGMVPQLMKTEVASYMFERLLNGEDQKIREQEEKESDLRFALSGVRDKEHEDVLKLLEKFPIVLLDTFGGCGKTHFCEVELKKAYNQEHLYVSGTLLHKKTLAEVKYALAHSYYERVEDKKWSECIALVNDAEHIDILQLIKEKDRKKGIKKRLIVLDEVPIEISETKQKDGDPTGLGESRELIKLYRYCLEHSDHFRFIWTVHCNYSKFIEEFLPEKDKFTSYILKPYSVEAVRKIKEYLRLRSSIETIMADTGGIPWFLYETNYGTKYAKKYPERIAELMGHHASYILSRIPNNVFVVFYKIKNGISEEAIKNYKEELAWLQKYGLIDLTKKENPIVSQILKGLIVPFMCSGLHKSFNITVLSGAKANWLSLKYNTLKMEEERELEEAKHKQFQIR